uniref:Uncharacterized protein n=1 Tax=Neogobius melanostomus TaxID=47308 RepID=A0A8C6S4T3_9GOBI
MATMTHGAPLREVVDQEQFQDLVLKSHSLIQKILFSIPGVHNSSIYMKTLQLKSPDNTKMVIMATNIGIPEAPVISAVSENCTLETSLSKITEGLHLHRELLNVVLPKLNNNEKMMELSNDVRDLDLLIQRMLKLIQKSTPPAPTYKPVVLRLPGEYDIQVAAHLTLWKLQAFGQDVVKCLRSMDPSDEEEPDS